MSAASRWLTPSWRNVASTATGSVAAIVTPKSNDTDHGSPSAQCTSAPPTTIASSTPGTANAMTPARTLHRRRRSRTNEASKRSGRNRSKMTSELSVGAEKAGTAPRPRPRSSTPACMASGSSARQPPTAAAINRTTRLSISPTDIAPVYVASTTALPLEHKRGPPIGSPLRQPPGYGVRGAPKSRDDSARAYSSETKASVSRGYPNGSGS